jgi:hypothetical protein
VLADVSTCTSNQDFFHEGIIAYALISGYVVKPRPIFEKRQGEAFNTITEEKVF